MSIRAEGKGKALLRTEMRARLQELSDKERVEAGQAIARHLANFLRDQELGEEGGTVAFFANLPFEIATSPLDEMLQGLGIQRILPSVEGRTLMFRRLPLEVASAELPRDRMGIPTPPGNLSKASPAHCRLLILPGLAFDRLGGRLGQGGGFYDRLLADIRGRASPGPVTVGIGFDLQLVRRVPMDARDQFIDAVCTPGEGVVYSRSGGQQ
jgi:5-formyltetrahydrofolate cyclo-ligase